MFYYVDIVFFSLVYVYVDIIFSISCMRYVDIAGNGESFICLARYCPGYRKATLPAHMFIIDAKLQYFQSLLRDEAIEVYQSLTITTETNLIDVLTKFWNEFAKDDLKEVARCKWDRAKYNPTAETFSDCLKCLKVIAKQAIQEQSRSHSQRQTQTQRYTDTDADADTDTHTDTDTDTDTDTETVCRFVVRH